MFVDGKPIPASTSDWGKRARLVCKAASIEPVTFHQLRHTYASLLAERAAPLEVSKLLGHADLKTTQRYLHLDTASLARDPRMHLTFSAPSGTVTPIANGRDLAEGKTASAE